MSRASTFKEEIHHHHNNNNLDENGTINNDPPISHHHHPTSSSSSSLAAQAIKASAARHDPSLSFSRPTDHQRSKSFDTYGDVLGRGDSKNGFWGVLAQKAKDILEDEISSPQQNDIMPNNLKSYSFKAFTPNALPQDGRTIVESKNEVKVKEDQGWQQQPANSQTIHETQLKASRDVRWQPCGNGNSCESKITTSGAKNSKSRFGICKSKVCST